MNKWMLMVAVPLCGTAAYGADTQPRHSPQNLLVEQAQQRYVYPDPEIPTLRSRSLHASEGNEDAGFEQHLWDLLAAGRLDTLKKAIAQRQAKIIDWQPPPWLKVELARAELNARINAARGNPKRLLQLFGAHPEIFTCREYYNLWSLADAYRATGELDREQEIHRQMLASCRESSTLYTTLDRVAERQGIGIALQATEQMQMRSDVSLAVDEMAERRYRWSLSNAAALRTAQQQEEASHILAGVEAQVALRRDLDAARLIAWNYHERVMPEKAVAWFEQIAQWSGREEDRVNALQARWTQGEHDVVLEWLTLNALQQEASRRWAASVLREEAANRFATDDFTTTLHLLDLGRRYDATEPVDIVILRGWALYKQHDYGAAHQAFAEAYQRAYETGDERESAAADGLLHTARASGDWLSLTRLADNRQGILLSTQGERHLVEQLAAGSRTMRRLEIRDGHLIPAAPSHSLVGRLLSPVEALPGYTWGTLRDDNHDKRSLSYVVNQGVDWGLLPGGITINTFIEYRDVNNEWRYLNNQTEGVAGLDLGSAPFHLGMEYVPSQWRGTANGNSVGRGYFSWYNEWRAPYPYIAKANASSISAFSGSTYGRLNANINGPATLTGYLNQGIDWFSFANGALFNTYAAYRFHLVSQDSKGDDRHGPALGMEIQHKPFKLGADYVWDITPQRNTVEKRIGIYLTWYYGWDLRPN